MTRGPLPDTLRPATKTLLTRDRASAARLVLLTAEVRRLQRDAALALVETERLSGPEAGEILGVTRARVHQILRGQRPASGETPD